jgi:uncharacterized protein (DUF736 family)
MQVEENEMNIIGRFQRAADGSFLGEIITLSVQAKNVRIVPDDAQPREGAPTHRVEVGKACLGAAWAIDVAGSRFRMEIDDPSFTAPVVAELRQQQDGTFVVVWQRDREPRS